MRRSLATLALLAGAASTARAQFTDPASQRPGRNPNQPIDQDDYLWVGGQLQLRAHREGGDHTGRTYTITCTATDSAGNTRSASTAVVVPHHNWETCGENH